MASPNAIPSAMETEETNIASDEISKVPINHAVRLMITKMELENFKSYGGVKKIGPFHKCFSAVVGPNGSGKSNVIDAMLFVFGKRASKLRLKKVSQLIHRSDAVKDCPPSFARVSVFFQDIIDTGDGEDDYKVLPNSERVVTRIAYSNNSSTYKLDGRNCAFKDVAAYLQSKGIDLDNNRFLILQGEVEMISMMPPKGKTEDDDGLLEYLEDIIGSSKFVEDTNVAAEKVESLSVQRQEKLNRVKAVEKEKDNLEGAKQEAEALLAKERELRRKKNILFQIHNMNETKELESVVAKKSTVTDQLEKEQAQQSETARHVKALQKAVKKQKHDYDKTFSELNITKEEFSSYERADIKLREEIKHAKSQLKKLEQKVKAEANKENDCMSKKIEAEESIPLTEQKIASLTRLKAEEDEKLELIQEETKGLTQQLRVELEKKTEELSPVNQELVGFQTALDTKMTEIKLLEDATTRAKEALAAAETELASIDDNQHAKLQEVDTCKQDIVKAKARVLEAQNEAKVLAEKEGALSKRCNDLLCRLEEARAALQSQTTGGSPAVKGILKAARKGGELSNLGVLGRLGDLATISSKYDVAVSTACGMLDHIVVQTTSGAQRCLEYLRKHQLGRANFIPLDKMKRGAHDRQVETPEGAPRLFELITPSNFAVTPAIFLAVGTTLVAPDLETATRWAYDFNKRWRVVTLDGKLIEAAGTMSGGGKHVRRGGMRISNTSSRVNFNAVEDTSLEDCKRLEEESNQAQSLLQQARTRQRELANEIKSLEKKIQSLQAKLPKLSLQISGFDTTRQELSKSIPGLRNQCDLSNDDKQKLAALLAHADKCKSDMAECSKLSSKLETEIAELQKSILNAGGEKLKGQQRECGKVLSGLKTAQKDLNAAKVTAKSSLKAAEKARNKRENAEKELEECNNILEFKHAEFKRLEEDAVRVMRAYETAKELEEEKRKELEAATKSCEELKETQAQAKCLELELQGKLETYEKQVAECKKKRRHWEQQIEKLLASEKNDDDFDSEEGEVSKTDIPQRDDIDCPMDAEAEVGSCQDTESHDKSLLPTLSYSVLEKYHLEDVKEEIDVLDVERQTLAKNANMGAIAEYRKKEADYLARVGELEAVTNERNLARQEHEELRRNRLEMFMDGFGQITLKLKEMYQMITLGGDAELELVDSLDPFSEGIVFSVRPPKKSWKNISNLSGGEKTLSSLALVFALHHFKPTPLYVMDEIDAALDFKNVSIVANYIKERTKNAQFIIISLRNNMFELADRLVGIYKTFDSTKSVTINPHAFGVASQQNGCYPTPAPLSEKTNQLRTLGDKKGSARRLTFSVPGSTPV